MDGVALEILLRMAGSCDAWSETLATRDHARQLAGYPTSSTFAPTSTQKNSQVYDLMRLSLLDLLVWHLLPDAFPLAVDSNQLTSQSDSEDVLFYQQAAEESQEKISAVIKTLVPVAHSQWPQLNNSKAVALTDMPNVLFERVMSLHNTSTGSKALANLHSLALGILLYTVRLS
jgi:hypothetical protein